MPDYPPINRSADYSEFIDVLVQVKHDEYEISLFPTIRDLLLFAAVLGFGENVSKPLGKRGEPIRWQTFENEKADEMIFLIALAATEDHSILRIENIKDCMKVFEEYANGGLSILDDWINRKYNTMSMEKAIIAGMQEGGFLKYDTDTMNNDDLRSKIRST